MHVAMSAPIHPFCLKDQNCYIASCMFGCNNLRSARLVHTCTGKYQSNNRIPFCYLGYQVTLAKWSVQALFLIASL